MKLAFLGAGKLGAPLAARLAEAGHPVTLGELRPGSTSVADALARSSRLSAAPAGEAVAAADVVFLVTPFAAMDSVIPPLADGLVGKVLVDCTNPVGPGLSHGLKSARSASDHLQTLAPGARVVKAFTVYGFENLETPPSPVGAVRPAMFFCGDDAAAKAAVSPLIEACGFDPLDAGGLAQALHLEHLTLLWIRMVRAGGHSPRLTWAALRG